MVKISRDVRGNLLKILSVLISFTTSPCAMLRLMLVSTKRKRSCEEEATFVGRKVFRAPNQGMGRRLGCRAKARIISWNMFLLQMPV